MFTYPMFMFLGMYLFIRNTAVYVVFAPQTYFFLYPIHSSLVIGTNIHNIYLPSCTSNKVMPPRDVCWYIIPMNIWNMSTMVTQHFTNLQTDSDPAPLPLSHRENSSSLLGVSQQSAERLIYQSEYEEDKTYGRPMGIKQAMIDVESPPCVDHLPPKGEPLDKHNFTHSPNETWVNCVLFGYWSLKWLK